MVLLVMTAAIVEALEEYKTLSQTTDSRQSPEVGVDTLSQEPSLQDPRLGNPISHQQLIDISKKLKNIWNAPKSGRKDRTRSCSLEALLHGSRVYTPPAVPKNEPTPEYKALMTRLRAEEEERQYERMINPPLIIESFSQRFPATSYANLFLSSQERVPATADADMDNHDDEITYADVNRQMALIANVLISIICCSVAIWMAASHWPTPKRLGLSMGGSGLVGVAEVVVYTGYLSRLQSAKERERKRPERKTITKTWAVGGTGGKNRDEVVEPVMLDSNVSNVKAHERLKNRKRHKT